MRAVHTRRTEEVGGTRIARHVRGVLFIVSSIYAACRAGPVGQDGARGLTRPVSVRSLSSRASRARPAGPCFLLLRIPPR